MLFPSTRAMDMLAPKAVPCRAEITWAGLDFNSEPSYTGLSFQFQLATVQFCLQDRVIINRIDNICHAILKGRWPSSSQQFEAQSLLTAPAMASNTGGRSSFAESEAPDPSFNNGVLLSRVQKVRGGPQAVTGSGLWGETLPRRTQEFPKWGPSVPVGVYNTWLKPLGPLVIAPGERPMLSVPSALLGRQLLLAAPQLPGFWRCFQKQRWTT